jgi:predicted outer membrane repeat protein
MAILAFRESRISKSRRGRFGVGVPNDLRTSKRSRLQFESLEQRALLSTFTVTDNSDNSADKGSLRHAITNEPSGTVINFAANLKSPIILINGVLNIARNLDIEGLGAGLLSIDGNKTSTVFSVASGVIASIAGLTIANGSAANGGGVNNQGTLTLTNCAFSGNAANTYGGGVYNGSRLALTSCTFTNNSAGNMGGGLDNAAIATLTNCTLSNNSSSTGGGILNERSLTLADCTLSGNNASSFAGGIINTGSLTATGCSVANNSAKSSDGGGIVNIGTLILTNCALTNNSAGGGGGGFLGYFGTALFTNCTFSKNSATEGGGIYNAATLTVTSSTFSSNVAGDTGGAVENEDDANLSGCTLSSNSADMNGGAIYSTDNLTATNCTLANNSAGSNGGGIVNVGAVSLINCTVATNSADQGGGIFNPSDPTIVTALANTIVAGNTLTGSSGSGPDVLGTVNSLGNNLIGDTSASSGWVKSDLLGINPLLETLGDYGGSTQTIALEPGSPAIDAGSASIPGASVPALDQRGAIRGPAGLNAGAAPDIGAFEDSSSYLVTSAVDSDKAGTLRAAVGWANVNVNNNDANLNPNPAAPNTIIFDTKGVFAKPQTITLAPSLGTLMLTTTSVPAVITGPGSLIVTVSGGNQVEVFDVSSRVTATITGLAIANGVSAHDGGGILNDGGTVTLTDSSVKSSSADNGGGIENSGTLTISNSTFASDSAGLDGGGIDNRGTLTITDSTLSNDSARNGGGLYNANVGPLFVTDCTLSNNSAGSGGAIFNIGQATLTNATLSGNSANSGGGAYNDSSGNLTLANTIIAGNTLSGSGGSGPDGYGMFDSKGSNLIGNKAGSRGWQTTDLLGVNPLLAPLGNYGGPTQTMALLPGSPALGAGDFGVVRNPPFPGPPFTDQRGIDRIMSGFVDIGAFESRGFTISVSSGSGQSAQINTAFAAPLVVSVASAFGEPVQGGVVMFAPPNSGASCTFPGRSSSASIDAAGLASIKVAANTIAGGPYIVRATVIGVFGRANFSLTNLAGLSRRLAIHRVARSHHRRFP